MTICSACNEGLLMHTHSIQLSPYLCTYSKLLPLSGAMKVVVLPKPTGRRMSSVFCHSTIISLSLLWLGHRCLPPLLIRSPPLSLSLTHLPALVRRVGSRGGGSAASSQDTSSLPAFGGNRRALSPPPIKTSTSSLGCK